MCVDTIIFWYGIKCENMMGSTHVDTIIFWLGILVWTLRILVMYVYISMYVGVWGCGPNLFCSGFQQQRHRVWCVVHKVWSVLRCIRFCSSGLMVFNNMLQHMHSAKTNMKHFHVVAFSNRQHGKLFAEQFSFSLLHNPSNSNAKSLFVWQLWK